VGLPLADEVADRRRGHEDLGRAHAALPVRRGEKLLGDDALQGHRQLHAHLMLLRGREDVDDAVHGLCRVLRVQGGEHKVAGLRRGQGGGDRLEVAHLADQDHVGVLAQRGLQAEREALGVRAQLALVHDAVLMTVEELDRVLDGHDVLVPLLVDHVEHRGERRGLARARGTGHEHEAARLLRELAEHRR
jgi:hypothetical protein